LSPGFAVKTDEEYDMACRSCEYTVDVNRLRQGSLRAALAYDKDRRGGRGRCLQVDLADQGLQRNDRLEPTPEMCDVAGFDIRKAPFTVVLWRSSKETMCRHRNPLLNPEKTGIGLHTIGVDWMHTISLGVSQMVLGHLVWAFIGANVFQIPGTAPNVLELTVVRLREALFAFYKSEMREGRNHTRVQQLAPSMFGASASCPECKLHASETNGFLFFAKAFVEQRGACLGASEVLWKEAISALCRIISIISEYPRVLPKPVQQEFVACVAQHMRAIRGLRIHTKPKHHFLIEMAGKPLCRIKLSGVLSMPFACCSQLVCARRSALSLRSLEICSMSAVDRFVAT
jgi:hypothetical protein